MAIQFSLVVTCYNEIGNLHNWQKNVLIQTRPPDEIVIVDSESNDGTTEFLKKWAQDDSRVKVIVEKCKPARGHNIGNGVTKFEHILSTDMGVRLSENWCEALITPFEKDPSVEVVRGNSQIDPETANTPASRADYYLKGGICPVRHDNVHKRLRPGNRSVCYTKSLWKKLEGLPEDLTFYADDTVFGQQIVDSGCKMVNAPDAMAYWARPPRLKDYFREAYNYGFGDGEALIKTPFAIKLFLQRKIPFLLIKPLTAFRFLQKDLKTEAFFLALKKNDLKAFLAMPLMIFGIGWFYAKGYMVGKKNGDIYCARARQRVQNSRINL